MPPDADHVAGAGHIFADELSRVFAPTGKGFMTPDLHPGQAQAKEVIASKRDHTFYLL